MSDASTWQSHFKNYVIVFIRWPGYNLQTRYRMRTRFQISDFSVVIYLKLCQIYRHHRGTIRMTSSWLSRDLVAVYRSDTNCGSDLASQVFWVPLTSNFWVCAGMNNCHVIWVEFADQVENKDQILCIRLFCYLLTCNFFRCVVMKRC